MRSRIFACVGLLLACSASAQPKTMQISQKSEPYQFKVAGVIPDYCSRYQAGLRTVAYSEFSIDNFAVITAWATCSNGRTLELHNT